MIRTELASALIAAASITCLVTAGLPRDAMGQDSTAGYSSHSPSETCACTDSGKSVSAVQIASATAASADSASGAAWLTRRDAVGVGVALAATVAVAPLDRPISKEFREPGWQQNGILHNTSDFLAFAGGPGPFLLGAGFFTVGEVTESPAISSTGEHVTESVLLAASVTALGKGIAGRALPGVKTKEEFEWDRGFHHGNGPFVSFPSGHTAAAFAMASALTGESAYWHPGWQRYVGPASYVFATGVGVARLYQNVHWASDLPLAAAIGTWAGLGVENHAHPHRHRRVLDSIASCTSIARSEYGQTTLAWSLPLSISSGKY